VAVNISALSNVVLTAQTLSNLILVTPEFPEGIESETSKPERFLFDFEGEQTITLEADITDHYVEDNTAVQDQIALKPAIVTTRGFVAELNDIAPESFTPAKNIVDKLGVLSAYVPELTITSRLVYNAAVQAAAVVLLARTAAVSRWTGAAPQTKQQLAYQKLQGYYNDRTLFKVQTPWRQFEHMAIKTLRAVQDPETRMITEFDVTFKEMKFASTSTIALSPIGQGRFNQQNSSPVDLGTSQPQLSTASPLTGFP